MLSWFNASEAEMFGESLARLVIERLPQVASKVSKVKTKKIDKKEEAAFSAIAQEILKFKQQYKLNIYKKAKLGNTFKWTLKDAGYDSSYVDQLTNWLMLQL